MTTPRAYAVNGQAMSAALRTVLETAGKDGTLAEKRQEFLRRTGLERLQEKYPLVPGTTDCFVPLDNMLAFCGFERVVEIVMFQTRMGLQAPGSGLSAQE